MLAVVGEHGVDAVGHGENGRAEEVGGRCAWWRDRESGQRRTSKSGRLVRIGVARPARS